MTPMSLRDQIRKLLQLHTHPDSRAEILACFDEMSGEPTQQQAARWCEEIRGFHESLVAASKFEANELGNLHAIDEALTSNACERAALRIAGLNLSSAKLGEVAMRANSEALRLRDQLAYACHQLARIAGAIDETGKAAEALMTGWGEEHGRAGEDTARHVTDEALDVMSRAIKLRSEEMAILDALRAAGEPISRWSTQHAVDRRRLRRNVIAADCGIAILERLGMIVVQRHEHFQSDDLISLALVSKVNP